MLTIQNVCSRILTEGGAKDITLLKSPFQRKDLYSGIDEVEAIQFEYILLLQNEGEDSCLSKQPVNLMSFANLTIHWIT